jgi:thioredoxin reductase
MVLVIDHGTPRNRHSHALHGYLTRDGIAPSAFTAMGREEIARYGIELKVGHVVAASRSSATTGFDVSLADGTQHHSKLLLLATGVSDQVPDIPGLPACYGRTVFHCPYCDGWEWRDRRLGVLADGSSGAHLALSLKTWSADVCLFLHGSRLERGWRERLSRNRIEVVTSRVAELVHDAGRLRAVQINDGRQVPCDALFFSTSQRQQSPLAVALGCTCNRKGVVATGRLSETNITGVFVAGDASHDAQYVAVAVAEGVKAALAMNQALQREELVP